MAIQDDDFVPVTGGARVAKDHFRGDVEALHDIKCESELDLHIIRLLTLHPQLQARFGNQDLSQLDDKTKQALLDDMNDLLGIKPSRTCSK